MSLLEKPIMKLKKLLNNEYQRNNWIEEQLRLLPENSAILDAGCGNQPYRYVCKHLKYYAQDFGRYEKDEKDSLAARKDAYEYGRLDYTGNIWKISEKNAIFDAILCTEVFEHIPYPNRTVKEFSRLLKPGGILILTVPANALRHMDPYFYYSGFSDRYLAFILKEHGFRDIAITPVGSYHAWLMVEETRSIRSGGFFALMALLPAFLYHYLKQRHPSQKEVNSLCFGYHVTAIKGTKYP